MLRFPGVSWLTVNTQGSTAVVALAEGVEKPDMEAWKRPCNIRSAAAGQILRMEVYAGQAEVAAGDAVTAGQLLVSGVTEDAWGGVTLHHAAARIVAETRREFTAAVPLSPDGTGFHRPGTRAPHRRPVRPAHPAHTLR